MTMRQRLTWLIAVVVIAGAALAWAADPVAVLTEVRRGTGDVRIKLVSEEDWKSPQPLMSLRPGDQLRASGDARAVVVLSGGGVKTVTTENSPFFVPLPIASGGGGDTVRTVVSNVAQFLVGKQKEPAYLRLTSRAGTQPRQDLPLILSPRETRLLPGPVTFVWNGADTLKYSIRVFGPDGLGWSESNLPRQPLAYPPAAPPLRAGVRYVWELRAEGYPADRAQFELVPDADTARISSELALLKPGALADYPSSTVALMRAGLMFEEGLYQTALEELLANSAVNPDEPTLRFMIGHVYDRMGLRYQATQAFNDARMLSPQDK
jgi:hypothetical protein